MSGHVYKIIGKRFLREYTEPNTSPVYAAEMQAQRIVEEMCNVPWNGVTAREARMTYHTDEVIDEETKTTGLDMNVKLRDYFDAALFCAGHVGGQHRAYANAAVYHYVLPDEAVGCHLTRLSAKVTSDPYNSQGARIHVITSSTDEIPTNCHTCRGEDSSGAVIEDGTTAAGVAPRTVTPSGGKDYWYPTRETATLEPTGGLVLAKHLFLFVVMESYSTVRGNWLEGCSFIDNLVEIETTEAVSGWTDGEVNDLSDADGIIEIPVVRHGTTQSNFSEVTGMCSVAVLSNGDDFNGAFDSEGQRRYNLTPYQKQLYAPETYDADPARFYIGLRTLYAKFYAGEMELATGLNKVLRPGAGFSVHSTKWGVLDATGNKMEIQGWTISTSVTALAFSAPVSLSVIKMKLDWGATGSGTGGTINGGHYNFWLKRNAYVNTLPESLVKNPDIYMADKKEVDGWEYLGSSTGDSLEVELSTPLKSEHATILVTAFADQKSSMGEGFVSGTKPWGASTEFRVFPSAVNADFSATTGLALNSRALMTPDVTLYGVGEEENANDPVNPQDWLCFTAEEAGSTVSMASSETAPAVNLVTSVDGGQTWTPFTVGTTVITLAEIGDKVYFAAGEGGNECLCTSYGDYNYFVMTGRIAASGSVTSLLDAVSQTKTIRVPYAFQGIFRDCTSLTTAPRLPSTTLSDYCYAQMFFRCTSLTTAPELPATTLAESCYNRMFIGCSSLTAAPAMFATIVAKRCCYYMFFYCTSLTTAPELPATTLADNCYEGMFEGCTALTVAPELPATTLATNCYNEMFAGCSSLTVAPELPATTLAKLCYYAMFGRSQFDVDAPYDYCSALKHAPALPATTLATSCYNEMFRGCTALTAAPELPATTLADYCYASMFQGCTSLTAAPELPATTLADYCYEYMFVGCSALNKLTTHQEAFGNNPNHSWVDGVAATGTFYCPSALGTNDTITRGASACPTGWTVINI